MKFIIISMFIMMLCISCKSESSGEIIEGNENELIDAEGSDGFDGWFTPNEKRRLISFTGNNVVACKIFENQILGDVDVKKMLKPYVLTELFIDDQKPLKKSNRYYSTNKNDSILSIGAKNLDFQINKFGTDTQPYFVIIDEQGNAVLKLGYKGLNKGSFLRFLEEGLNK